ncbi:hypothetical protein L2X99_12000 [Microbacterium sp. KUDC0406]|uniref:hypothetical protein n=1 Tax=Microbacterium sp. KUDC0406 TaxID=2909588 RepID=UPI001F2244E2|nr:hypothetical protein [Microbacterium sp. KUDC0406]UJP09165.1 hypothetical protein L2X99_12000 [Microbacterium sp. KUDC0406]
MTLKRWAKGRRRLLAVTLTGILLGGGLVGCGAPEPGSDTEETTVDYGDVSTAVTEAVPRVVEVDQLQRSRDGFGYRLSVGLVTDSAEPFTSDELDAVIETIWLTLPWEPGTIKLVAGVTTADEEDPVDLRAAAAELAPLTVTNAGQGGVSVADMKFRYGAWTAPE